MIISNLHPSVNEGRFECVKGTPEGIFFSPRAKTNSLKDIFGSGVF